MVNELQSSKMVSKVFFCSSGGGGGCCLCFQRVPAMALGKKEKQEHKTVMSFNLRFSSNFGNLPNETWQQNTHRVNIR